MNIELIKIELTLKKTIKGVGTLFKGGINTTVSTRKAGRRLSEICKRIYAMIVGALLRTSYSGM